MTKARNIRVVLADDHTMVREGLSQVLADSEVIEVVGQAADGFEAVSIAADTNPDVMVLDYSMPKLDAPGVMEQVRHRAPNVKVLILTIHENIHYAVKALESGAHGYVIKAAAVEELVEAIETVDRGEVFISSKISQKIMQHLRRPKKRREGLESLSQREFDLLRVLGAGSSLKECASFLNISTSTASTYRSRLMEKLNLNSTAAIIRFALENEIVG